MLKAHGEASTQQHALPNRALNNTLKIGLLTYHHVVNPGSALQTYCGYKLLQLLYPKATVEVIDYYPTDSFLHNKSLKEANERWENAQVGQLHFLKSQCNFSPFKLRSDDVTLGMKVIKDAGYDLVVTGSDTVFQIDGFLGYYLAGPAAPNLYYLPDKIAARKIALAVSFDPPQQVEETKLREIAKCLSDFEFISYRDQHAYQLMKSLGIAQERLIFSPDPTILVDFHNLLSANRESVTRTDLVGISIANGRITRCVTERLSEMGYETLNLLLPPSVTKTRIQILGNLIGKTPKNENDFIDNLAAYRRLSGLVTDRFHGSIFGFQLGDYPVVGIEDDNVYPTGHGKLWDLYERLGLKNSKIRTTDSSIRGCDFDEAWSAATNDVSEVRGRMAKLREQGMQNVIKAFA